MIVSDMIHEQYEQKDKVFAQKMTRDTKSRERGSIDWILLCTALSLTLFGLVMIYSSTLDMGMRYYGDRAFYLKRQLMWLGIGLVGMLVATRLRYHHWMKLSIAFMAFTVALLLTLVLSDKGRLLIGQSVSPVELAKLATVIYIGHWLSSKGDSLRQLSYGVLPFTIIVGIVAGLVMAQPDISEAMVIILVSVVMFFLAGADVLQLSIGLLGGGVVFAAVVSRLPHAIERLKPYLSELKDPLHSGNVQLSQGILALSSGGLLGLGLGNGRMKYMWLPAAHTDSIYTIVGEELGLVGCLILIGLYGLLAYRGLRIAARSPDPFGTLLAAGFTSLIIFQTMINIAVVTGTIPFTGISLPFISVGGSSLVTNLFGVGILLSISRETGEMQTGNRIQPPPSEAAA